MWEGAVMAQWKYDCWTFLVVTKENNKIIQSS